MPTDAPTTHDLPAIPTLRASLDARAAPVARAWLDAALTVVRRPGGAAAGTKSETPPSLEQALAAAGRVCGRGPLPAPLTEWTIDDATRCLLLHEARVDAAGAERLYRRGDAAERRAVLRALPYLPVGADAVPLLEDALRTNDTRLIAAAVGPYAARHLGGHAWRHAVLKCVFTGVSVSAVAGLAERADAELGRMLWDYARERTAAGRDVPADVDLILALLPER
ncbi:EboA domain-containing protein [Streptomyces sp. NPDC051322]|uniref:EboA domain-containing protein n=1 Tax=Streptomyces sp. NPDC051322 TaxID=3154645 RepID=UPI00344E2AF6